MGLTDEELDNLIRDNKQVKSIWGDTVAITVEELNSLVEEVKRFRSQNIAKERRPHESQRPVKD